MDKFKLHTEELYLNKAKYKIEAGGSLTSSLQKIGIKQVFNDAADSKNISPGDYHLSDVVHQVKIEVDEVGTVAVGIAEGRLSFRQ